MRPATHACGVRDMGPDVLRLLIPSGTLDSIDLSLHNRFGAGSLRVGMELGS